MQAFIELGQNIFLCEPQVSSSTTATHKQGEGLSPPSMVILCTWLGGATTKRVHKYTTGYRQLFPNAHILLIRTTIPDITLRSFQQVRMRLAPARDIIRKIIGKTESSDQILDGSILMHIFSHGGCNTAIQLAISMREDSLNLPLGQIVFDCCPGDATFQKAYNAAALSLPSSQPVRLIGWLALYPFIAAITGLQNLGIMSSVKELRAQLNDSAVFGSHARRLYLYSAADQMVGFQDVQSHLNAARARGYRAHGIMFQRSLHCALILEDAERYWTAIKNFWQDNDLSHVNRGSDVIVTKENAQKVTTSLSSRSKL
jgi:hypothetical protein